MFAGGGGGGQSFTELNPNAGKKTDDFPDLGEAVDFGAQKKTKKEREKEERKKAQEARQAEIDAQPYWDDYQWVYPQQQQFAYNQFQGY